MTELANLLSLSRYAGARPDLVQSAGGNTSVKLKDGTLLVKSSGLTLSEVTATSGFTRLRLKPLRTFLSGGTATDIAAAFAADRHPEHVVPLADATPDDGAALLKACMIEGGRPSIETFLHVLTSHSLTLHTHPAVLMPLLCSPEAEELCKMIFPDAVFVPYALPGLDLARALKAALSTAAQSTPRRTQVILLQNHGLAVSGDTVEEIIAETEHLLEVALVYLGDDGLTPKLSSRLGAALRRRRVIPDSHSLYVSRNLLVGTAARAGLYDLSLALCPDYALFLGERALILDPAADTPAQLQSAAAHLKEHSRLTVLVCGTEVMLCASSVREAQDLEAVLAAWARTVLLAKGKSLKPLPHEEVTRLTASESERYRQALRASPDTVAKESSSCR